MTKSLVIARVGASSIHPCWIDRGKPRDWDLYLCPYQPIAPQEGLDCIVGDGPEFEELSAALLAYDETKDVLRESRERFAAAYREVFAPFAPLDGAEGRAVLTGLVGAAEALARDVHDGTVDRAVAIDALTGMMCGTLARIAGVTEVTVR